LPHAGGTAAEADAVARLDDDAGHAVPGQAHGHRQPHRPAADDRDAVPAGDPLRNLLRPEEGMGREAVVDALPDRHGGRPYRRAFSSVQASRAGWASASAACISSSDATRVVSSSRMPFGSKK
jgi:hypothetical protein